MNMPIVNIENLTDEDRQMLTSYYRHWWIIDDSMEVSHYTDGKPVFKPVKEEDHVPQT